MLTRPVTLLPGDVACLAMSDDGYLCGEAPHHRGDHVARAAVPGSDDTVEVARWPRQVC